MLFDMETPGVSTRPILLISGSSPFCETFFDDVKVPKDQIVGEVNKGWDVAKYLLGHEREMISGMGLGRGGSLGAATKPADPLLRAEIAAFDVDALAFAAMSERFTAMWKAGEAHPAMPVDDEICRDRAQQAPQRADDGRWRIGRARMGKRAVAKRRDLALMAPLQGQFDRGRNERDPAQHRRQAHPSSAGSLTMSLLTDDQKMLQETAASFLAEEGSIARQLRHWREIGCKDGFGHGLWKQLRITIRVKVDRLAHHLP